MWKRVRAGVFIGMVTAYPFLLVRLHATLGQDVFSLNFIPIMASGLLLSAQPMVYAALATWLVNMGISVFIGEEFFGAVKESAYGLIVGLAAGILVLLLRNRNAKLKRETARRERAEEEASRLAAIVDSSEDAVIEQSPDGTIVSWNAAAEKVYGYTAEEAKGRAFSLLTPPDRSDQTPGVIEAAARGGHVDRLETVHRRKDGRLIEVLLTALPVVRGSGETGTSVIVREITERKDRETLHRRNVELSALFDITSALNESLNVDTLLPNVLRMITDLGILYVERKAAIFVVEGGRMNLLSHVGLPDDFVAVHSDMKVGDCLCGLAAQTGEVIISKNSRTDERHRMDRRSVLYSEMEPHGHLIVPIKVNERVSGVLCLFLVSGVDVEQGLVRLLLSIGNQIGMAIDNARLYEETKALSLRDPLTGLANRRLMDISIEKHFASAKRYERPFSAIMLDIDHFKQYNDTHGHSAGDALLVDIAGILSREVRETDLVVRYGGEEFLILLPEITLTRAYDVAERMRGVVSDAGRVTISAGVATYQKWMEKSSDIINMADDALYHAKQRGRNRTVSLQQARD